MFSRAPVYLAVLLTGVVAYLQSWPASQAAPGPAADAPPRSPSDDAAKELAATDIVAEGQPAEEVAAAARREGLAEKPAGSGNAVIDREAGAFVMLDSPSLTYRLPDVAVRTENDLFQVPPVPATTI